MHLPWLEAFENIFNIFVNITIHGLELMGIIVVVSGAISAFYGYFVRHAPNIRLSLAQSMAIGLEFKLGGEILRTVIARDWNEILTVGAIIALRAALNFLIHWEISHIQHDAEIIESAQHAQSGLSPSELHAVTHLHAEGHLTDEQMEAIKSGKGKFTVDETISVDGKPEKENKAAK